MKTVVSLEERAERAESPKRNLVAVSLEGLAGAEHKPHPFSVWPIIPARVVTLLSAHGGIGKSNLALTIAAHVACGRDLGHYRIDEAKRALFVSLEDAGDLVRFRLRRIAAAYDLPIDLLQRRMTIVDGSAGDGTMAVEYGANGTRELVPTATHDEVCDLARGHGLIVVDNASDAFGANENDRRQVRAFMRMLAAVARDNDAGMLLLSHVDKAVARFGATSDRYSGSTAWNNSARSRLELAASDGVITLSHAKHNLSRAADPMAFAWSTDGVLLPADATTLPNPGASDAEALAAALEAAEAAGAIVPTARTGPATAQTVMETMPDLPANMRGTKGRASFWTAVATLQRAGRLHAVEFVKPNRHKSERFALVPVRAFIPTPLASRTDALTQGVCASAQVCADSGELTQTDAWEAGL